MGATALLYLGPLLAGLGGYGWSLVPAFVLIFLLWLIAMRPQDWPRARAEWRNPAVWTRALVQILVQVVLVVVCFGIGQGLGGVTGVWPLWTPLLPVSISFLAVPLGRLIWNPVQMQQMDGFLDDALRQIGDPAWGGAAVDEENVAALDAAYAPLLDLPLSVTDAEAEGAIAAAVATARDLPGAGVHALVTRLDNSVPLPKAAIRGLVLWGTTRAVAADPEYRAAPGAAFALTWYDNALLQLFAERALTLIEAEPELWLVMPEVEELRYSMEDAANSPGLNALLARLAERIVAAMPPEMRPAPDAGAEIA